MPIVLFGTGALGSDNGSAAPVGLAAVVVVLGQMPVGQDLVLGDVISLRVLTAPTSVPL